MADATYYMESPPQRLPRLGGIRSVAEFRDGGQRLALGGIIEWSSTGCQVAVGDAVLCYPADDQDEKTLTGIATLEGVTTFGAYVGVECYLDGGDFEAAARELLLFSEDRAIEGGLDVHLQALTAEETVATFLDAIAAAEQIADDTYPGRPVLVLNRGDAVRAAAGDALEFDREGNLWTPNGTPVLSSARITANSVSVTGGITVLTGPVTTYRTEAGLLSTNREMALAERAYGLALDCEFAVRFEVEETP